MHAAAVTPNPEDRRLLTAATPSGRWVIAAIAAWTLGALLLTWRHVDQFVAREHARQRTGFDQAWVIVVQRLDQNEALLDGLVALLRSSRDREFAELRGYADEMLARYPHLYTIGYQPRVGAAQRADFERRMSEHTGQPFRIRDFSLAGDRTWRDAPPRPFYFPVTFMAPELPDARSIIGYDVYDDRQFRDAIERSAHLDEPVSAPPFDLVEGGRGYTYLRALRLPPAGDTDDDAPAGHLVSLLIRADRLFAGVAAPDGGRLELRHRGAPGGRDGAAALIGGLGEPPESARASRWALPLLPELRLLHATNAARQPFDLELVARPRWRDFAWQPWAGWLAAWAALVLAALAAALALQRAHRLRRLAQAQAAQAHQDLAAAERRAESSRARSLDELGSGIAHELNQPLAAVVGYSQAALRLLGTSAAPSAAQLDEVREALQANAQQALRAGALMQRLRNLVHKQPVLLEPLQMRDVIASALRIETSRIEAAGVVVDVREPASGVTLRGDAMLLEQLLANLLRNAIEALAPQRQPAPRIDIETALEGGVCRLSIGDNGPGLSEEQTARAFHPFQSTKPGGIGIGLVVCAAIVQAHGGQIAVSSHLSDKRPGQRGARFVVTLPLQPAAGAATTPDNATPTSDP